MTSAEQPNQRHGPAHEHGGGPEYCAAFAVMKKEAAGGSEHREDRRRFQSGQCGSSTTTLRGLEPASRSRNFSCRRAVTPIMLPRNSAYLIRTFGSLTAPAAAAVSAALMTNNKPVEIMDQVPRVERTSTRVS